MNKRGISRFYPPGYNYRRWNSAAAAALVILMLAVLIEYSSRYGRAFSLLYKDAHLLIIDESRTMEQFSALLKGCFSAFWLLAACCVIGGIMLRAYFSQHSNSIYTMRRLKSRGELARRYLAAPAALLLAGFILCIALMLLMRLHYQLAVPKACLPPENSFSFWEMLRAFAISAG